MVDPIPVLAVVLLAGWICGSGATKIGLPSVTGQILAGFLIGHSGLHLFGREALDGLHPLTTFALGLIAVSVGSHLNVRRLSNAGRRLFFLLIAESLLTPLVVFFLVVGLTPARIEVAILLSPLAISTAPATIVALVQEMRAKGVFVKTLLAAVALNNIACIFFFELARAGVHGSLSGDAGAELQFILLAPLLQLLGAALVGAAAALIMSLLLRVLVHTARQTTAALATLLLVIGASEQFGISALLACAFFGTFQSNFAHRDEQVTHSFFASFEPAILTIFFTLAGAHLDLGALSAMGSVALVLILARILGKVLGGWISMHLAGTTLRVRRYLGWALIPQAGVAVGLVILVDNDPALAGLRDTFAAVALTTVALNEIIGPLFTRMALKRSGEAGKDRRRIMDFLQEQSIITDFDAPSKEEALDKLISILVSSNRLSEADSEALRRSIFEREAQVSTSLGQGLAIPHGTLAGGGPMVGIMALSREGLHWESPDGLPVHCIILLATPEDQREHHLEVLAAIARTLGGDSGVLGELYRARSAAHAYEILHGEESEDFNYFLEE